MEEARGERRGGREAREQLLETGKLQFRELQRAQSPCSLVGERSAAEPTGSD